MTAEPCPQGRTDYEACFAPFRYCPVKGCGRAEGDRQLPTEATLSDFEAGRRAATADIVAALRRQTEHHDPNASIATVIWRDAAHLAQRVGDGHPWLMPPDYDSRYLDSDEEVAEMILADLNYRRLPYENAMRMTTAHVQKIRAAAHAQAVLDDAT